MNDTWNDFISWERTSRDTIDFKKIYVDMADGDLVAGLMLSELVYWYLPSKDHADNKLQVIHEGEQWIAIWRYEWWDRTRISPKQADRAIDVLKKCGLITTEIFKFSGSPTVHIRINKEAFTKALKGINSNPPINPFLPKGKNPNSPKVNNDIPQRSITLTENTAETTTEIKTLCEADKSVHTEIEKTITHKAKKPTKINPLPSEDHPQYLAILEKDFNLAGDKRRMTIYSLLIGMLRTDKTLADSPVLLPELRSFVAWYRMQNNQNTALPLSHDKLLDWIAKYRKANMVASVTHVTVVPSADKPINQLFY